MGLDHRGNLLALGRRAGGAELESRHALVQRPVLGPLRFAPVRLDHRIDRRQLGTGFAQLALKAHHRALLVGHVLVSPKVL